MSGCGHCYRGSNLMVMQNLDADSTTAGVVVKFDSGCKENEK